jgi:hypothetical protein
MDAWQFALFFVALLVGYVLVHLRLVRFEEHLQKLAGIRSLDDRLRQLDERLAQLVDAFGKLRVDRIEAQLGRLHDDLEDVRDATSQVQHAVVQIPVVPAAASAPGEAPPRVSPAARLVEAVEGRLLQLGYHDIALLTDLATVDPLRDVELQVECWKGGMLAKGRVLVRNGSVRDVALQSVAPMFP